MKGERRDMFEKFGEMGSAEEINELARNLRGEGDKESVIALAEENGIEPEIAEVFNEGEIDILCDDMAAAVGKIDVECAEMKPKEIVEDWIEYIKGTCAEHEEMARAVRAKGKTVKGCIAEMLKWSFKNCYEVDRDTCKEAGVTQNVKMGIPGMARAKEIIKDYYLGQEG